MSTEVRDNPELRRFEIFEDGVPAGLADYTMAGDRISLVHTETSPEFGGRGLARQFITFALDQARERHLKVVPITEDQDSDLDLVPADVRARFSLPEEN